MIEIRVLNRDGIDRFQDYLEELRDKADLVPPDHLLDARETSNEFAAGKLEIDELATFRTKRQAGRLLSRALDGVTDAAMRHRGLWSWLALLFFDQICPPDKSGRRRPAGDEHYIYSRDYRRDYRHKLATPFELYKVYPEGARCFLDHPVEVHGEFLEQLGSRLKITSNRSLVEVIDYLYFDDEKETTRRGATTRDAPGTINRLVKVKAQLDKTYDLYSMAPAEIVSILPSEFQRWLQ